MRASDQEHLYEAVKRSGDFAGRGVSRESAECGAVARRSAAAATELRLPHKCHVVHKGR
jgi:hypothetical protein